MKTIIASIIVAVMAVIAVPQLAGASPATTFAQGIYKGCNGVSAQNSKLCGEKNSASVNGLIKNIVNLLLFIVGIVAVIMIIIGGIKYTTSSGDAAKATSAKNTIIYAVVGLVVAAFAYAIVSFVVGRLT